MTLLNDADAVRIGTSKASAAYAGAVKVWPRLWTPADLGINLWQWLDASDAATITVTGSGVAQWRDKSSYGRTVAQSFDAVRPPYSTGRVEVYDQKALQSSIIGYPVAYDFIFAGKTIGASKYRSLFLTGAGGAGTYVAFLIDPSDLVGVWTDGFHQAVSVTWPPDTEALVYTAFSGAANVAMAKNGAASLTVINTPMPNTQLTYIGQSSYAQGFGDLYELVVVPYNSPIDTRQKLEGYLAWKWGLAGLLPVGHPYKTAAP